MASIEEVGFTKNNESKDPKGFRRLIFQILVAFFLIGSSALATTLLKENKVFFLDELFEDSPDLCKKIQFLVKMFMQPKPDVLY